MEKQLSTSKSSFFRGLLIKSPLFKGLIFLFFNLFALSPLSAQSAELLTPEMIGNLVFIPTAGRDFFADTEIKFEVFFPYADTSQISFTKPSDTSTYTFNQVITYDSNSDMLGTHMEAYVTFLQDGNFTLPPVHVKVNRKDYQIPFEMIKIGVNPQNQKPVMIINFNNGTSINSQQNFSEEPIFSVTEGEAINFTTSMQYALQLFQEKSELPKDSLFIKTKSYDEENNQYHDKDTIGSIFPISDYKWTPLVSGLIQFPSIKISVTSYSGNKTEIKFPPFYINVTPSNFAKTADSNEYFDDAFSAVSKTEEPIQMQSVKLTEEQCQKIAELRNKERNSVFNSKMKQRIEYEKSLGLPSTEKEFRIPLFYIYLGLTIIFIGLLIFFIIKRKIFYSIIVGTILVAFSILITYSITKITKSYAISKGCTIQSIPEVKVESKSELPAGTRIIITAKSSGWIYVELGETCGWCHEDEVIIIK